MRTLVWEYIKAVGHHWRAWLSGSAVLAFVGIVVDAMPDVQVPIWVWGGMLFGGLLVAQFKAWQAEHEANEKLEDRSKPALQILFDESIDIDRRDQGEGWIFFRLSNPNGPRISGIRCRITNLSPFATALPAGPLETEDGGTQFDLPTGDTRKIRLAFVRSGEKASARICFSRAPQDVDLSKKGIDCTIRILTNETGPKDIKFQINRDSSGNIIATAMEI